MNKKIIKVQVSPEVHKEIKVKAAQTGKSMKQFILDCIAGRDYTDILCDVCKVLMIKGVDFDDKEIMFCRFCNKSTNVRGKYALKKPKKEL